MASVVSSEKWNGYRNRLGLEKSPYLLQHANNPVDWYPWGQEAFTKAQEENKIIFLSVGYSTCHWCHVMERESFENEEIGKLMNENFVCIKVDREERPDVDKVYMTFVQATSGHGGWPMSVWITPHLKPIVGATYFPPDDRYYGRPGFKSVLKSIAKKWQKEHSKMVDQGNMMIEVLNQATQVRGDLDDALPHMESHWRCCHMLAQSYDTDEGGFSRAPKFPQPVNFNYLFRAYAQDPTSSDGQRCIEMATQTLVMMAKGGIHDHINKGFHRYSTDNDWHVPHFEKMLYDQAQLAVSYVNAYQVTGEEMFADVARGILQYVSRDLSDQSGGFYSAEDADSYPTSDSSAKKEGAFCVWTQEEVHSVLNQPLDGRPDISHADIFCHHFDVREIGNVNAYQDPHDELKNQNVLIVRDSVEATASHFSLDVEDTKHVLEECRKQLYEVRCKRPPPHLDSKMITAWNGLMISGFAQAGSSLGDQSYTQRAEQAAQFLKSHLYNEDAGILLHSIYVGEEQEVAQISVPISGFLDDYAFLIRGLLDLYEACLDCAWLRWAEQLQDKQDELFWDQEHAGYFASAEGDDSILIRMKDDMRHRDPNNPQDQDGAEPSGNSVSAMNLLRLAAYVNRQEYHEKAVQLITTFGERISKVSIAVPEMVCALMFLHSTPKQIIIAGERDSEDTQALLRCVYDHFLPNRLLLLADGNKDGLLYQRQDVMSSLEKLDEKATAYVCENWTCSLPVTSVSELKELLTSNS